MPVSAVYWVVVGRLITNYLPLRVETIVNLCWNVMFFLHKFFSLCLFEELEN